MIGRAAALALACGLSAPAAGALAASSGGSGLAGAAPTSASVSDSAHHYPGDSRHLGDRILRSGMSGRDVSVLQSDLTAAGFPTPVTGYFGTATKSHVERFQKSVQLKPDGIVSWSVVVALQTGGSGGATAVPRSSGSSPTYTDPAPTGKATLVDGLAVAPSDAPAAVREVIAAANKIATKPYIYGGGHGSFHDSGYDCSGSVSYALHGGGLLSSPLDSTELESYGSAGAGRWISIWSNSGHTFMYVAGLRFDTGAQSGNGGDRWTTARTSTSGFVETHPTGY